MTTQPNQQQTAQTVTPATTQGKTINPPPSHEETLKSIHGFSDAAAGSGSKAGTDYAGMTVAELHALASERNIEGRSELTTKDDLVKALKKSDK